MIYNKSKTIFDWKFFLMLLMVLFVGGGSELFESDNIFINRTSSFISLAIIFVLVFKTSTIPRISQLIKVLSIVAIWVIISVIRIGHYDTDNVMLLVRIVTAYLVVVNYRFGLIEYFEKVIFFLICVALVGWGINNIVGSDVLHQFALVKSSSYNNSLENSGSFILYTISAYKVGFFETSRNFGFCWEPGRFASMIVLGTTCYLIKQKGVMRLNDKRLWVYILAMITTYSTTGYSSMLLLFALCTIRNTRVNILNRALIIVLLGVTATYVFALDFMSEKIENQLTIDNFYSVSQLYDDNIYTATRFEGIMLDWQNFLHNPILGYGVTEMNCWTNQTIAKNIVTSNGLTKIFAMFGIILGSLYFRFLYKGMRMIVNAFDCRPSYLLFVIFVAVSVSYNFSQKPLFLAFLLFPLFNQEELEFK